MNWQRELKRNISTLGQLKKHIELTPDQERQLTKVTAKHPMSITRYYMSLIDNKDPNDPLRKMLVPAVEELDLTGSYDPCRELQNTKLPGLQHKYSRTALILATSRCASYCRYCFRKRLVGLPTPEILRRLRDAVQYIREHVEVDNVLLSGGDPFVLTTEVIGRFLEKLSAIPHLNFIRFGTRVPATFPDRILEDAELLDLLGRYSLKNTRIHVVTQFNHPREITEKSTDAVSRLIASQLILKNQTVLLKGVNDDPSTLAELQSRLVGIGVSPYYVFQCRPVRRVKRQFQVSLRTGYHIVEEAKKKLNGPSKRFRYIMSHATGKVEIVGVVGDEIYLKYHEAKSPDNIGRFFKRRLTETARWLAELERG